MNRMDKRGLKRKVVMVQLRVLGMLGMHEKKAQVLRNSGLFKKYGGGGVLAYFEYAKPSMENVYW